jgi:hypothetical protein
MLVQSLSFNLLSVRQLAMMGLASWFDLHIVTLMWSKSLSIAFVGYVENGLYVVDFSANPHRMRHVSWLGLIWVGFGIAD